MCGIVGCTAQGGEVVAGLVESLKRLEYRGYDSSGIAAQTVQGIGIVRRVGKIRELEAQLQQEPLIASTAIGHTRWATHGRPTEANAHPHRCGKLVVVHNGIIENYLELRQELGASGAVFQSETDTEVVAHLVASLWQGDLAAAVRAAVGRLEGSFALALMHEDTPEVIVAARRDSPLVLGVGEGAHWLASDVAALLPWTRRVIYLEDGDVAELHPTALSVTDMAGKKQHRPVVEISWSAEMAEKGGYAHFMLKEIHEQPTTVANALLGRIAEKSGTITLDGFNIDDDTLRSLRRVSIVACGTSWHAGQVGRFLIEQDAGLPVEVDYASEAIYREPMLGKDDLLIAISQSGETADTRAALRRGREAGAHTLVISNVAGSSMARDAQSVLLTYAGPEIGVASTKAFMGQLTVLSLLALKLGAVRGKLTNGELRRRLHELKLLPHAIEAALHSSDAAKDIAAELAAARDALFIGRGVNYPIALEGALKLKEISYIHAEGYPAGEMKHGPIALIDASMPVIAIATHAATYAVIAGNVEEAKARGARIIALVSQGDDRVAKSAWRTIVLPAVPENLSPLVNIVPLQLLAYWTAVARNADVDQPRNLAKTVTVQ
ncbi:MAG: glutamine--fructose-6-phosphate transaminase (isomerizing) [Planctomycetes bacterium]|nr:glutamine--fructose-6-phosphate transaminase (isomerizing) [Planctomycetota bacterium]